MHNRNGTQKHAPDSLFSQAPALPVLSLLAEPLRQRIMWELADEPSTPTALARALGASQPLVSKHLRILRNAGLVESHRAADDHRSRIYDICSEQLIPLQIWLNDLQHNSHRRPGISASEHNSYP